MHIIYLDEVQELLVLADGPQESEMSSNHYLWFITLQIRAVFRMMLRLLKILLCFSSFRSHEMENGVYSFLYGSLCKSDFEDIFRFKWRTFFFFWLLSTVPNHIQSDVPSHSNYLLSYAYFYCWLFVPFFARYFSYLFKNMSLIFSYVRPQTLMGQVFILWKTFYYRQLKENGNSCKERIATVIDAASATPFWNKGPFFLICFVVLFNLYYGFSFLCIIFLLGG